jgi:uncharacterized protein YbbK (DUF523 family)
VLVVSACLAGERCRYDGSDSRNDDLLEELEMYRIITVCPEQMGGLPTPRTPAEIEWGNGFDVLNGRSKVLDRNGADVTASFLEGALEGLKVAKESGAKMAYLKENSPSCGVGFIRTRGEIVEGPGVFTALLSSHGFKVLGV